MSRRVHGWLHDEQGDQSISRLLLVVTIGFAFLLIVVDVVTMATAPAEAYALLGSLIVGLIAWAGGARIARYVGPQIAGVVQGITAKVSPGTTTVAVTNTPTVPAAPPTDDTTPHEWAAGDPDEGTV